MNVHVQHCGCNTNSSVTSCSSSHASLWVSWLLPVLLHVQMRSLYLCRRASYSLCTFGQGSYIIQMFCYLGFCLHTTSKMQVNKIPSWHLTSLSIMRGQGTPSINTFQNKSSVNSPALTRQGEGYGREWIMISKKVRKISWPLCNGVYYIYMGTLTTYQVKFP